MRRAFLRRSLMVVIVAAIAYLLFWNTRHSDRVLARETSPAGVGAGRSVTLLSRTHTLDRIYESMQGPFSNHEQIRLLETPTRELLWITGLRSSLVGQDGSTPISREFFCHSNLTFHLDHLAPERTSPGTFAMSHDYRLFTLVPGRLDVSLPDGFGIPVYSDEPLDYFSMSLNLNLRDRAQIVRFRTAIDFVRASESPRAIKPLFRRALYGFEPIGTNSPHTMCMSSVTPGASCGPFVAQSASDSFVASLGKTNTIHWMIPPGEYESRVPVDEQLDLPFDTTVHYVSAHLHPYGKSVALVDKTTGKDVFTIRSGDFPDKIGVATMEQLSLAEGEPLSKDHHYELVTKYENPTLEPIDAMSILYLYALDKTFMEKR